MPTQASSSHPAPSGLVQALAQLRRGHPIPDEVFDRIYPVEHRQRSWSHWTPIDVALRACQLLAESPDQRILDVGSGVGKLCLIGALTTRASWVGIERDFEMVDAAILAARRLGVDDRARFAAGDIETFGWSEFDAFYLFNPFAEALHGDREDALARRDTFVESVESVRRHLARSRPGTRVVTYHGFGGQLPGDFARVHREPARGDELCLWIKNG